MVTVTPALPEVFDWLVEGDVAIQFQAYRDLLGEPRPDLQARISAEGVGAALLAARRTDGHWGHGFYQPKWTSTHYTMLELKNLGVDPAEPALVETVAMLLATQKGTDGGLNPSGVVAASDVCINGMALGYCSYFGASADALESVVDVLLGLRMPDGGFNCRLTRSGARHSSVRSTIAVLEGITEHLRRGYDYRRDELAAARAGCVEFFLRHRLYRSERTGEPIDAEFTRAHHPARWHFDVLRCLDALRDAGVGADERMSDGLALLRNRQRPDGRWVVARAYPGATHVPVPPAGRPDRWVTLMALRVLATYPGVSSAPGR